MVQFHQTKVDEVLNFAKKEITVVTLSDLQLLKHK